MKQDIPRLMTWVTATEAAEELGVARQSINKWITSGKFKTVHQLGVRLYVVKRSELEKVKKQWAKEVAAREAVKE